MATSQTLQEENAIVLATVTKFVTLGQQAAVRIVDGKSPDKLDQKAESCLQLLTAYRRADQLSDDNLESLLNAMKMLSGANRFPSVDPIVGQSVIYRVTGVTPDSGSGGGSGTGVEHYRGRHDVSTNAFPSTGGNAPGGGPAQGDYWIGDDASSGTLKEYDESPLELNAPARVRIEALIDNPGQFGVNWKVNQG